MSPDLVNANLVYQIDLQAVLCAYGGMTDIDTAMVRYVRLC